LNIKCPQLSNPKATVARNPNLGGKLGETRLSLGASSPLANERTVYNWDSGRITVQKSDSEYLSSSIWLSTFIDHMGLRTPEEIKVTLLSLESSVRMP